MRNEKAVWSLSHSVLVFPPLVLPFSCTQLFGLIISHVIDCMLWIICIAAELLCHHYCYPHGNVHRSNKVIMPGRRLQRETGAFKQTFMWYFLMKTPLYLVSHPQRVGTFDNIITYIYKGSKSFTEIQKEVNLASEFWQAAKGHFLVLHFLLPAVCVQ